MEAEAEAEERPRRGDNERSSKETGRTVERKGEEDWGKANREGAEWVWFCLKGIYVEHVALNIRATHPPPSWLPLFLPPSIASSFYYLWLPPHPFHSFFSPSPLKYNLLFSLCFTLMQLQVSRTKRTLLKLLLVVLIFFNHSIIITMVCHVTNSHFFFLNVFGVWLGFVAKRWV